MAPKIEHIRSTRHYKHQTHQMSAEDSTCDVCTVACNKKRGKKRPINCPVGCEYTMCIGCWEEWFDSPTTHALKCPNCNEDYNVASFMKKNRENLPKNFFVSYLRKVAKVVFRTEKNDYLEKVETFRRQKNIDEIYRSIKEQNTMMDLKHPLHTWSLQKKMTQLEKHAYKVRTCPDPECSGKIYRGKCDECQVKLCNNCVCVVEDPSKHGKDKCHIMHLTEFEKKETEDKSKLRDLNWRVSSFLAKMKIVQTQIVERLGAEMEIQELFEKLEREFLQTSKKGKERAARRTAAACPVSGCNGIVFASNWKCVACDANVCSECQMLKESDEHTCDPNVLETLKYFKELGVSKCPCCSADYWKPEGCDQIWCPQCGNFFSHRSKEVFDRTKIFRHNPEYLAWASQQREAGLSVNALVDGRNNDHECRQPVTRRELVILHTEEGFVPRNRVNEFPHCDRLDPAYVAADTTGRLFQRLVTVNARDREKLQYLWFLGKIRSDEEWIERLIPIVKKEEFHVECVLVIRGYVESLHQISLRYVQDQMENKAKQFYTEYQELVRITQTALDEITELFGYKRTLTISLYGTIL